MAEAKKKKFVLVGRIGAAHGLKGQVRINSFTGDPLAIATYPLHDAANRHTFTIRSARPAKGVIIASLEGITRREQAEALNGTELYVQREYLAASSPADEDEFLHADLIGLEVHPLAIQNEFSGTLPDRIVGVENFGAGDILEIKPEKGESYFLPLTRRLVPEVDIENGFVRINRPVQTTDDKPGTLA